MNVPPEPPREDAPEPEPSKTPAEVEEQPGARYVFKILPADPKNTFDFEDVADK